MQEKFVELLDKGLLALFGSSARRRIRPLRRFTAGLAVWFLIVRNFFFHIVVKPVPASQGKHLVDRTFFICNFAFFTRREHRKKYRVALLVDEFFGGWRTAVGGYGGLARKYVCKYVPNDEIEVDVLLNTFGMWRTKSNVVDGTSLYKLSIHRRERQSWLDSQGYNLFLSIEMTGESSTIFSTYRSDVPLLYWVQDPRDLTMYQSRLKTVTKIRDDDWAYLAGVADWMRTAMNQGRVAFISQGQSLSDIARAFYQVPERITIKDLPNPVDLDLTYDLSEPKQNKIIFLGRLEAQKRVWMVCELATMLPQYEFYIIGATGRGRNESANREALSAYRSADGESKVGNLHFVGFLDGERKQEHLKTAKLLVNTSIWEGIPLSWLEALSFGTLVVGTFDRDDIVKRFGTFVGEIMGDGTREQDLRPLSEAIVFWMENEAERTATARNAIDFVRRRHSIAAFQAAMREAIVSEIGAYEPRRVP